MDLKRAAFWLLGLIVFVIISSGILYFLWIRADHEPLIRSGAEMNYELEKAFHDIRSQNELQLKSLKDLEDLIKEFRK